MHESQMHDYSSFITLTYDDEHLPYRGSLNYTDFQKFLKRARRKLGPFRFFACGEYGEQFARPHYHACLFGVYFGDREFYADGGSGSRLYTSRLLSQLWPYGFASVGDVTFQSASYVASYVTKKAGRDSRQDVYLRMDENGECYWLEPESGYMSRRPGIGATWWNAYGEEVLNRGNVVMNGVEMKVPRYYGKLCKDVRMDWVESQNGDVDPLDSMPERLAVREKVTKARLAFSKSRKL